MATVKACSDVFLLVCGENIAVFDYRNVDAACVLSLPVTEDPQKQKTKQKQHKTDSNKPTNNGDQEADDLTTTATATTTTTTTTTTIVPTAFVDATTIASSTGHTTTNRVLAVDVSRDGQYLAVCDDHKYLHLFHKNQTKSNDKREWTLLSSRCVPRRCSTVVFTSDGNTVLVSDKSGDVYSFPCLTTTTNAAASATLPPTPSTTASTLKEDGEGEGEEDSSSSVDGGNLVLGHLSMLLDTILVNEDSLIVTADRDEKIRISQYPDAYNIHTYCLGHTAFVITLAADHSNKLLFSGSGDGSVKVWTYDGTLVDTRVCVTDFPQLKAEQADEPTEASDNVDDEKHAVQQIVFCPCCSLLFVAMYRCSSILVYRLLTNNSSNKFFLQPVQLLDLEPGCGSVVNLSMAPSRCVLWVVAQQASEEAEGSSSSTTGLLRLSAFRVSMKTHGDMLETSVVEREGDSVESRLLQATDQYPQMLKVPSTWQDPIPTLWKSMTDGYLQEYMQRKKQRLEDQQNSGSGSNKPAYQERWGGRKKSRAAKKKQQNDNNDKDETATAMEQEEASMETSIS